MLREASRLTELMALGRYLGMFKDRSELSGPGGGRVPIAAATVNLHELTDEQLLTLALGPGITIAAPSAHDLMDDRLPLGSTISAEDPSVIEGASEHPKN
jgi:hypothetical protein